MQPGSKKLVHFMQSWTINTLAVLVAVAILQKHISYGDKLQNLLLLGILNAFVRPILIFIALPLLIFTLGLFTLVINALLLSLLTLLLGFFHITGSNGNFSFGYAFLGALIISIISSALNVLTTGSARISIQRRGPPHPPKSPGGGNGPVIDV